MADGMTILIAAVHDGMHPDMPIVDIVTADGETTQWEVGRRSIVEGRYNIGWPVGRRPDGAMLVEITTQYGCLSGGKHFGGHRIYVPAESLRREDDHGE